MEEDRIMKKWNTCLLLLGCLALVLTGCSKNNDETNAPTTEAATEGSTEAAAPETRTEYKALDYVTLGEYKNLELAAADVEITEDEIQEVIDGVLVKLHTEVKDRVVEEGDTVNIDYEGLKDGVAFNGGTAQGADLTIGSGQFIPGFEEGLIGAKPGEEVALNLTFPEEYKNSPDLAGQEVVFNVTVNYIKGEVTELTDELVAEHFTYTTVAEYRDAIKESLYEQKVWAKCFEKIIEAAPISEYPAAKDEFVEEQKSQMSAQAAMYGMDLEGLLQAAYQISEEEFVEKALLPAFEEQMRIHAIAEKENFQITEEEFQASLEEIAEQNKASVEDVLQYYGEDYLRESFLYKLVFDLVVDSAVIK